MLILGLLLNIGSSDLLDFERLPNNRPERVVPHLTTRRGCTGAGLGRPSSSPGAPLVAKKLFHAVRTSLNMIHSHVFS